MVESQPQPVFTRHLLRPLHDNLLEVLRSLDNASWDLPTIAGSWRVRDVVVTTQFLTTRSVMV